MDLGVVASMSGGWAANTNLARPLDTNQMIDVGSTNILDVYGYLKGLVAVTGTGVNVNPWAADGGSNTSGGYGTIRSPVDLVGYALDNSQSQLWNMGSVTAALTITQSDWSNEATGTKTASSDCYLVTASQNYGNSFLLTGISDN